MKSRHEIVSQLQDWAAEKHRDAEFHYDQYVNGRGGSAFGAIVRQTLREGYGRQARLLMNIED